MKEMRKTARIAEKVSTVGIRNQVTMPKVIRESLKITTKITVFIKAVDKEKKLVITVKEPESGVYNKIKISEKGQLVVPKNLRESMGIKEGMNLMFSKTGEGIKVTKLERAGKEKEQLDTWQLVIDFFSVLQKHGLRAEVKGENLLVTGGKGGVEFIRELEEMMEVRVMVEKTAEGIELTPLS